jgi:HD-GYP domain-containing protein (c-di-GMP phosphodiesterase class II)
VPWGVEEEPSWETVFSREPGARTYLSDAQFDRACQAIADFADIKSPYTIGHSSGVANLAAATDVYHAMTEPRPHRPARTPEVAASECMLHASALFSLIVAA